MCDNKPGLGKFEREPCYAESIYEMLMNGMLEEKTIPLSNETESVYFTDKEFCDLHGIPDGTVAIGCWEDDNGFFYVYPYSVKEYENTFEESFW